MFQGIKDEGTTLPECLAQVFSEDVLIKLGMGSRKCKIHSKKLDKLIQEGVQVNIKTLSKKFQVRFLYRKHSSMIIVDTQTQPTGNKRKL